MYCPKCAAPIEGTKFCRSCGANVSLVPQALTGELPVQQSDEDKHGKHKRHRPPSIEGAAAKFFTGIGFIFVALAIYKFMPGGFVWWFWMLIPAFASIGSGVGQYLKVRELERRQNRQAVLEPVKNPQSFSSYAGQAHLPSGEVQDEVSAPTTSELKAPASVTEDTTRHLDAARNHKE